MASDPRDELIARLTAERYSPPWRGPDPATVNTAGPTAQWQIECALREAERAEVSVDMDDYRMVRVDDETKAARA